MKHFLLILLSLLLLAGCKTTKNVREATTVDIRFRDSVVVRDSVVYRFVTDVHDSIVIRDSIVIVKDGSGKIVGTERHRSVQRDRNRNTSLDSQTKGSVVKAAEKQENRERKMDSKSTSNRLDEVVRLIASSVFLSLLLLIIYKTKPLWRSLLKTDRH